MSTHASEGADHSEPGDPAERLRPLASVRVVRPDDLLVFEASWIGLTLDREYRANETQSLSHNEHEASAVSARLVAGAKGGRLTIQFPFQHTAEFANPDGPDPDHPTVPDQTLSAMPPVPARAARPSRLVFLVPPGEEIAYSTAGLLEAMARLELAVAPVAAPAPAAADHAEAVLTNPAGSIVKKLLDSATKGRASHLLIKMERSGVSAANLIEAHRALVAANRVILGGIRGPITAINPFPNTAPMPRKPTPAETAIEAPFRLILSPSTSGAWAHAQTPVSAGDEPRRVELWHSRLAVRHVTKRGVEIDEIDTHQRIVRAIWTRDRERAQPEPPFPPEPFEHSLAALDREDIVRQTTGSPLAPDAILTPVSVRRLALSSLGAWLDIHASFNFAQYLTVNDFGNPLASWDHVAPMGRDQFVRIVRPGFLFPIGHRAYLVTITYRKVVENPRPQAALFKRRFIVLGDPVRAFARPDLPFLSARLGPLRTPDLKDPGAANEAIFWPEPVNSGAPFFWKIDASDHDGEVIHLEAPLLFVLANAQGVTAQSVATNYAKKKFDGKAANTVDANGQTIAFAPALVADQATGSRGARASAETRTVTLDGVTNMITADPFLMSADVVVPAIQRLTPGVEVVTVNYPDVYRQHQFGSQNVGNVFLELASSSQLNFGSSERSGGFVRPDISVGGLARSTGLVADVANAAAGKFKPETLFGAGFPKLFGLINLADLIKTDAGLSGLDDAPKFLSESLDRVSALLQDVDALEAAVAAPTTPPALKAAASVLGAQAKAVRDGVAELLGLGGPSAASQALTDALNALPTTIAAIAAALPGAQLGPMARSEFDRLVSALTPALKPDGLIAAIEAFGAGLNPGGGEFRARLDWRPELIPGWPADNPILKIIDPKTALRLSVEARSAGAQPTGTEVAAELTNFSFNLLPVEPLMRVRFDRLAFRGSAARRPEVDVVFGGIEFVGILGFIEVLKELIPLDGFSDPPFLDVSAEGVSAGFTVALPNVAIGLFSLSNLALAADARIPFLGDTVSVGFSFCTRERPFTLAVFPLGGGGFVGIRLSPKGLVLLEAALEFGAVVALDFGVASGSVSAMGGIYFRLEGPAGSLTGYFRIRGEVDVLSLISASIELYMALTYAFDSGKMIGEASITIHVEVLFFSTSVSVRAQRTFAGSNGDPTARQMLMFDSRGDEIWNEYWAAFAPATI